MESPLSFFRMHGDHEPCEWSAELLFGTMPAGRMQNTVPNWSSALRFMESPHVVNAMHWDHEPRTSRTVPPTRCCRRPVGRASPRFLCRQDAGSTLWFMESPLSFFACIGIMNRWPSRTGRKAPINRTHSKRFALAAESVDDASAFGVRASSAPLSQAGCDSMDEQVYGKPPRHFCRALGP